MFFADLLGGRMRRPRDPDLGQVGEPDLDRTVPTTEHRVEGDSQARDRPSSTRFVTRSATIESLSSAEEIAGHELAFSAIELQREGELGPSLPGIVRQSRHPVK